MKSSKALIFVALILAAVLLLGIGFAIGRNEVQANVPDATDAVRSQDGAPPKELWYLGGAPILDDFSTSGGPEEPDGVPTTIVIYVPLNLVQDGFPLESLQKQPMVSKKICCFIKLCPQGIIPYPKTSMRNTNP